MQKKRLQRFVNRLNNLAAQADEMELRLPNGAIVGCMLGGIAADLEMELADPHADRQ